MAVAVARIINPPSARLVEEAVLSALKHRKPITLEIAREDPFGSETQIVFKVRHVSHVAKRFRVIGSTYDSIPRTVAIDILDEYDGPCTVEYTI